MKIRPHWLEIWEVSTFLIYWQRFKKKMAVLSFGEDRMQNIILGVRVQFEQWGN